MIPFVEHHESLFDDEPRIDASWWLLMCEIDREQDEGTQE